MGLSREAGVGETGVCKSPQNRKRSWEQMREPWETGEDDQKTVVGKRSWGEIRGAFKDKNWLKRPEKKTKKGI